MLKENTIAPGTEAKIVSNTANHGFPMGTKVTIDYFRNGVGDSALYSCSHPVFGSYNVYRRDIEVAPLNRETINAVIAELQLEIDEYKERLAYMDETASNVYDETEFKVWSALKALDDKSLSKKEQAVIIAKLIKE